MGHYLNRKSPLVMFKAKLLTCRTEICENTYLIIKRWSEAVLFTIFENHVYMYSGIYFFLQKMRNHDHFILADRLGYFFLVSQIDKPKSVYLALAK